MNMNQQDIDPENLLQDNDNDPQTGEEVSEEEANNLLANTTDVLEVNNQESFSDEESEEKEDVKDNEIPKSGNAKIYALVQQKVGVKKSGTKPAISQGTQEEPPQSLGRGKNKNNRRKKFRSRNPGSISRPDLIVVTPTATPSESIFASTDQNNLGYIPLRTSNTVNQQVFGNGNVFERLGPRTKTPSPDEFQDVSALQGLPATVNPENQDYIPLRPTSTVNEEVFCSDRASQRFCTSPTFESHQEQDASRLQGSGPSSSSYPAEIDLSIKVTFDRSGKKQTHSDNTPTIKERVKDNFGDEDLMIIDDDIKVCVQSTGKSLEQIHFEQSEAALEELRGKRGVVPPNALRGNVHKNPRFRNFEISKNISIPPKRKRLSRPRLSELTGRRVKTLLLNLSDDLDGVSLRRLASLHAGGDINVVGFDYEEKARKATIIFATEKAAKSMAHAMSRYVGEDGRQIQAFEPVEL